MTNELRRWIEPILKPNEELIWAGQPKGEKLPEEPDPSVCFRPGSRSYLYLGHLLVAGFVIVPLTIALTMSMQPSPDGSIFAPEIEVFWRRVWSWGLIMFAVLMAVTYTFGTIHAYRELPKEEAKEREAWEHRQATLIRYGNARWFALTNQRAITWGPDDNWHDDCCIEKWTVAEPGALDCVRSGTVEICRDQRDEWGCYGGRNCSYEVSFRFGGLPNATEVLEIARRIKSTPESTATENTIA